MASVHRGSLTASYACRTGSGPKDTQSHVPHFECEEERAAPGHALAHRDARDAKAGAQSCRGTQEFECETPRESAWRERDATTGVDGAHRKHGAGGGIACTAVRAARTANGRNGLAAGLRRCTCAPRDMLKEEIKRVTDEYMGKGLSVVAISSNCVETKPLDSPEEMVKDCEEYGYNFPYLFDDTQEVAKAYKAACTPEFFVFSKSGRRPFQLEYHGQFDNARPSNDVRPTGADLRNALDYVLSGRKIDFIQKPSIGCNIKWKPGNEPEYFQG
eukprot:scaffold128_cov328-Pavlova_lutheri.AAC.61